MLTILIKHFLTSDAIKLMQYRMKSFSLSSLKKCYTRARCNYVQLSTVFTSVRSHETETWLLQRNHTPTGILGLFNEGDVRLPELICPSWPPFLRRIGVI